MFVSLTRVNTSNEPIGNASIVGEEMVRWLRDIDGFEGFLMLSREGTTLGLTFWRNREIAERHRAARMEFLERMLAIANVTIQEIQEFDLALAHVGAGLGARVD